MASQLDFCRLPCYYPSAMAYAGTQHQVACELQNVLVARCKDDTTDGKAVALLARSWIALEQMKREIRGIPPLAPHKVSELLRDARATAAPLAAPVEVDAAPAIDETKESLSCQTVTAPPTPEPPTANG